LAEPLNDTELPATTVVLLAGDAMAHGRGVGHRPMVMAMDVELSRPSRSVDWR